MHKMSSPESGVLVVQTIKLHVVILMLVCIPVYKILYFKHSSFDPYFDDPKKLELDGKFKFWGSRKKYRSRNQELTKLIL